MTCALRSSRCRCWASLGGDIANGPPLEQVVALLKERASTTHSSPMRQLCSTATSAGAAQGRRDDQRARAGRRSRCWQPAGRRRRDRKSLAATVSGCSRRPPQDAELAMPVRLLVTGRTQTPSLDAVLELLGRETVLARLFKHLHSN